MHWNVKCFAEASDSLTKRTVALLFPVSSSHWRSQCWVMHTLLLSTLSSVVQPSHSTWKCFRSVNAVHSNYSHTSCNTSRTSCIRIAEVSAEDWSSKAVQIWDYSQVWFSTRITLCFTTIISSWSPNHTMKFSLSDKCKMKTSTTDCICAVVYRQTENHKHMIHQVCAKWPTVLCRSHYLNGFVVIQVNWGFTHANICICSTILPSFWIHKKQQVFLVKFYVQYIFTFGNYWGKIV